MEPGARCLVLNWEQNMLAIYQKLEEGYLVYVRTHQQINFSTIKIDFVSYVKLCPYSQFLTDIIMLDGIPIKIK